MSYVRAPSRETAASPGPGLDQAASFVHELYGQDFGLRAGSADDHPPFRLAETEIRNHVDPLAIANRARDLRSLFMAAVAWTVNAVARWITRHAQRRHLSDLSDYLLRDIGIRRDQIDAVVSGSLKRGPSKLETAAAAVSIIGDHRGVLTVALNAGRRAALAVVCWYKRRKAIRELMALDDRTLKDINVRRDDIYWVTGKIFSPGEDPFHFSPASPPPGSALPEAWTVAGREKIEKAVRRPGSKHGSPASTSLTRSPPCGLNSTTGPVTGSPTCSRC
jgi:uncharacterized protein YjiS (DUF1127 family)